MSTTNQSGGKRLKLLIRDARSSACTAAVRGVRACIFIGSAISELRPFAYISSPRLNRNVNDRERKKKARFVRIISSFCRISSCAKINGPFNFARFSQPMYACNMRLNFVRNLCTRARFSEKVHYGFIGGAVIAPRLFQGASTCGERQVQKRQACTCAGLRGLDEA